MTSAQQRTDTISSEKDGSTVVVQPSLLV